MPPWQSADYHSARYADAAFGPATTAANGSFRRCSSWCRSSSRSRKRSTRSTARRFCLQCASSCPADV